MKEWYRRTSARLLNLGIEEDTDPTLARNISNVNHLVWINVAFIVVPQAIFFAFFFPLISFISIGVCLGQVLIAWLNHKKFYTTSRILMGIELNLFQYLLVSLFGNESFIQYYHFHSIIIPFIFFSTTEIKKIIVIEIAAMVLYSLSHFGILIPFNQTFPEGLYPILQALAASTTMLLIFITCFLLFRGYQRELQTEQQNRSKTEFIANLAHEVRNPMASVFSMLQLLNESPDISKEHRDTLDALRVSSNQLIKLLNESIDVSRTELGKIPVNLESTVVGEYFEELKTVWNLNCKRKNLAFNLEVKSGIPDRLKLDATKLSQIINNLLNNSLKFTVEGSISLTVRWSERDSSLVLTVRDTGCGIKESERESIFNYFQQGSGQQSHDGGFGIGLALVKLNASLLGGRVSAGQPADNRGAEFIVTIPAVSDSPDLRTA